MEKIVRVLYIEDDENLGKLLQRNLVRRGGFVVDLAGSGEEGIGMVAMGKYDAILIDQNLPGCTGTDVIKSAVGKKVFPPMIMVTSDNNAKVAVEAMKNGAADFLNKDSELRYLELAPDIILRAIENRRVLNEREEMEIRLKENEERYRTLVELSPDGIGLLSNERFELLNPSGLRLLNIQSLQSLQGVEGFPEKHFQDFIVPEDRARFVSMMREVNSTPGRIPAWEEFTVIRKDLPEGKIAVEVAGIGFQWGGRKSVQIMFRDISDRKAQIAKLKYQALTDPLTQLPNRTLFSDRLASTVKEAWRYKHLVAVLFVDLDQFKEINDTLGHDAGDAVLVEVAKRIQTSVRGSDTVGRMGGDEFCVLLTIINDKPNAGMVAEKLLSEISAPILTHKGKCQVGASIGVSFYPSFANDPQTLLTQADAAMYQAKRNGRNRVIFYETEKETSGAHL